MTDMTKNASTFGDSPDGPPVITVPGGDLCCPHCGGCNIYHTEVAEEADGQDESTRLRFRCETCEQQADMVFTTRKDSATSMVWRRVV